MNNIFYYFFDSGLKIVHRRTPNPVSYVGIMVGAGTRDELPDENGMAHYIEHCVFKGTAHHTARQLIRSIEGVGGEINAYTTKEETTFYAATLSEHLASTLHLIMEMVCEPSFPKEETEKELQVIYDEIESYNDSPSELIYDDFEGMIFRGHPLSMPILGTRRSLRHISRRSETAQEWMRLHYDPARMVIFTEGDLPFDKILHLIQRELDKFPALLTPRPHTEVTERTIPAFEIGRGQGEMSYRKHTHQIHLMLGGIACPLGHENHLPTYLMNNILGGGSMNSRLNLSLREKKGLVYTIESQFTPLSDTGYWNIYLACDPKDKERCIELTMKELKRFQDEPLSAGQMTAALRQLRGQMAIAAENRENSVLAMAKSMLYFGKAPSWQESYEKIAKTQPEQMQAIAQILYNHPSILTYE